MLPLYLARIEDLRRGDLVKVDCAACRGVADAGFLVAPRAQPQCEGPRPQDARPVPRLRSEGASRCVGQVGAGNR